jgi:hypothetical protein
LPGLQAERSTVVAASTAAADTGTIARAILLRVGDLTQ